MRHNTPNQILYFKLTLIFKTKNVLKVTVWLYIERPLLGCRFLVLPDANLHNLYGHFEIGNLHNNILIIWTTIKLLFLS